MKTCTCCKRILDLTQFYPAAWGKDKRSSYCCNCQRRKTKEWTESHQAHVQAYSKAYCARPTVVARRKKYMKRYMAQHWEAEHKRNVEYVRNRRKHDLVYRLRMNLRNRLNNAIRRQQKRGSAVRDLGCTVSELKAYLEAQFQPGMSWSNWSRHGWNIHHKRALETFDLTDPIQLKQAVHYTNLQPVWFVTHSKIHTNR